MAETPKILGNLKPGAASQELLYVCPSSTNVVSSSLVICNQSATPTSFRIAALPGGGTVATTDYLYYDTPIAGNDTFIATIGVTLEATDEIEVYNTLATCSFAMFGVEIT